MSVILVIDDDTVVREAISDILEMINATVLCAADGPEGIEIFKQNLEKVDGIIIDRRMPKMDGIEALQELRKIRPGVPIIMSSGYANEKLLTTQDPDLEKPDAYLYKPYEIDDLISLVENIILKR